MSRPSSRLARLPFFYGWVVVAVAFVTLAVAVNVRTAFSLLFPPILDEFGWDRGTTAAAFSVGFLASTAFTPLVGHLMDRWGPRIVIPLGAMLVSAGLLAATAIETPVMLYLTLGLMVVGGSIAMSFIGHSMFLPSWFEKNRGLAIGLAFSGVGVGAMGFLPLLQTTIVEAGWRTACLVMAGAVFLLIPLNFALQRRRPADLGLEPDGGGRNGKAPFAPADRILDKAWAEREWTLGSAARTARFWWIFVGYFCGLFAWYAVQVHQTKFLVEAGFSAEVAAVALGLVGLFGIFGQIGIGVFSDRVGREHAWAAALLGYAVCYAALLLIAVFPVYPLVLVMVAAQGLFGYGLASLYGAIPADIFAGRRFASIFSVTTLGGNLGAGVGPWVTGILYDTGGSYLPAFWLALVLSFVSIFCIYRASPGKVRIVPGRLQKAGRVPA